MKTPRTLVAGCAVLLASVSFLPAQTLTSVDFNPIEGTTWADSSVRLDFGDLGLGTVTFTPINGGGFQVPPGGAPFPYNAAPYSAYSGSTTLSNGAIFSPTQEVVFNILPSDATGLAGFNMKVTLDSGAFTDGSVFSVRSLAYTDDRFQYLQLVDGLGSPDSTQLPTDGLNNPDMVLVDADRKLYGPSPTSATTHGAASGLAFGINGGNTFSVNLLSTTGYQPGGVALTIALAPIPEPSAALLGVASLGGFALIRRRRH